MSTTCQSSLSHPFSDEQTELLLGLVLGEVGMYLYSRQWNRSILVIRKILNEVISMWGVNSNNLSGLWVGIGYFPFHASTIV